MTGAIQQTAIPTTVVSKFINSGATDSTIISTEGKFIEAYHRVSSGTATWSSDNGVVFSSATTGFGFVYSNTQVYNTTYSSTEMSANIQSMLDTFVYREPAINTYAPIIGVSGLTVGEIYLLQVFCSDGRFTNRLQTVKFAGVETASLNQKTAMVHNFKFTATATVMFVEIKPASSAISVIQNGWQLRRL
jgi:hypothetical protein